MQGSHEVGVKENDAEAVSPDFPEFTPQKRAGVGTVTVASDPDGAELFMDEKFVANSPAKLKLAAGSGCVKWKREIEVMKDSQVNLDGILRVE